MSGGFGYFGGERSKVKNVFEESVEGFGGIYESPTYRGKGSAKQVRETGSFMMGKEAGVQTDPDESALERARGSINAMQRIKWLIVRMEMNLVRLQDALDGLFLSKKKRPPVSNGGSMHSRTLLSPIGRAKVSPAKNWLEPIEFEFRNPREVFIVSDRSGRKSKPVESEDSKRSTDREASRLDSSFGRGGGSWEVPSLDLSAQETKRPPSDPELNTKIDFIVAQLAEIRQARRGGGGLIDQVEEAGDLLASLAQKIMRGDNESGLHRVLQRFWREVDGLRGACARFIPGQLRNCCSLDKERTLGSDVGRALFAKSLTLQKIFSFKSISSRETKVQSSEDVSFQRLAGTQKNDPGRTDVRDALIQFRTLFFANKEEIQKQLFEITAKTKTDLRTQETLPMAILIRKNVFGVLALLNNQASQLTLIDNPWLCPN